jgi:hypothetical protein
MSEYPIPFKRGFSLLSSNSSPFPLLFVPKEKCNSSFSMYSEILFSNRHDAQAFCVHHSNRNSFARKLDPSLIVFISHDNQLIPFNISDKYGAIGYKLINIGLPYFLTVCIRLHHYICKIYKSTTASGYSAALNQLQSNDFS